MGHKTRFLYIFLIPALLLVLAACGTPSTSTGSTPTVTSSLYATPTGAPPTATPTSGSTSAIIKTASVTIGGQSQMILTNSQGLTLYIRTSDTATAVCSGTCANAWPPLLFSGSGSPTSASTLSGTLSTISDTNGTQVTYQGHPLYTYAGDSAPGDVKGQGLGGVWYAATTNLTAGSSSSGATPTATSSY
jgi:predicted lipoprotein with Yx(FWY)xxD motif